MAGGPGESVIAKALGGRLDVVGSETLGDPKILMIYCEDFPFKCDFRSITWTMPSFEISIRPASIRRLTYSWTFSMDKPHSNANLGTRSRRRCLEILTNDTRASSLFVLANIAGDIKPILEFFFIDTDTHPPVSIFPFRLI
jgi:hypothetical protein